MTICKTLSVIGWGEIGKREKGKRCWGETGNLHWLIQKINVSGKKNLWDTHIFVFSPKMGTKNQVRDCLSLVLGREWILMRIILSVKNYAISLFSIYFPFLISKHKQSTCSFSLITLLPFSLHIILSQSINHESSLLLS